MLTFGHNIYHALRPSSVPVAAYTGRFFNGEVIFVKPAEIVYCAASNTYTTFHLEDGNRSLVSRLLREYEELLTPYGFLRVHQSYPVNREAVRSFSGKTATAWFCRGRGSTRGEAEERVGAGNAATQVGSNKKAAWQGSFR